MEENVFKERKKRAVKLYRELTKLFPGEIKTELENWNTPWQLLVSVIMSAQCTDKMVNRVNKGLFMKYPHVEDFAIADHEELAQALYPISFYRAKAKNIIKAAQAVLERFGGEVPKTMTELITLPGVARKTANVVQSEGFGISEGIAVDTHVRRFAIRYDLTDHTEPVKIERDLMSYLPQKDWFGFSNRAILYGRRIAPARRYDITKDPLIKLYPKAAERFRV
jgi:endonuclease-3